MAFVLTPQGGHLIAQGAWWGSVWTTAVAGLAVCALAAATGGWIVGPARRSERLLCVPAALLLLYLEPLSIALGLACFIAAIALHLLRRRTAHSPPAHPQPAHPQPAHQQPAHQQP
jgi:TRAP-type uncharacterized transport system fused permease subunit